MSDTETSTPRRTVRRPATDQSGIDYGTDGWPELASTPYVPIEWYEQHGFADVAAVRGPHLPKPGGRPRTIEGHASDPQLTAMEAEKLNTDWTRGFQIVTLLNMMPSAHRTTVPGARPGQMQWVEIPAFGVVRGPLQHLLGVKVEGEPWHRFLPIPARGNCDGEQTIPFVNADGKVDGSRIATCKLHGCTRPGHGAENGVAHSINQAYLYIAAIGQPHPDPSDPEHRARYVPDLEHSLNQIDRFTEIDPRHLVATAAAKRAQILRRRESRIRIDAANGRSVAGR